eukprot:scaffold102_cov133-Isochrysis_galbana.AAC.9
MKWYSSSSSLVARRSSVTNGSGREKELCTLRGGGASSEGAAELGVIGMGARCRRCRPEEGASGHFGGVSGGESRGNPARYQCARSRTVPLPRTRCD